MADEQVRTRITADADFSGLIADVHKVTASLSKLQEKIASSNKMFANQIAVMNRSFSDTLRSTGQFSTHFVSLNSDVEKFGKNLDSGQLKLNQYYKTMQNHAKTSGGLIRDLAKQQVALQNAIIQPLGRNAQGLMQFNVQVPRGLDEVKNKTAIARQELQIMNKVVQQGAGQLINWGKNTQWAGRQLTVGLTLPLAAFGKAAADAFRTADAELTRLVKVYGDTAGTTTEELGKVRQEVEATAKALSQNLGASYRETLALGADIAATGKTGQELIASIEETTRLAVLGEVDRAEAMKATLAIQSAFKQNTDQLSESINFLNAVENQTSTSLNDLVEAIPKAGPVIQGLGGSVKDLALYLTAMREGGINASEGANALKSGLASLINPTDKAVEQFKGFGIDLLGIVNDNAGSTTDTLLALQAALDQLDPLKKQQAIENLFGKFQFSRMNALFENLGKQGSQTLQVLDLMKASTGDLGALADRELKAVTESASGRYNRAVEGLKAELATVGNQFLAINTTLINVVTKILEFVDNLPKPLKQVLTLFGGLTAVAGPLIMLTGVLANFFGYIVKGVFHMKALFKGGEGWKYLTPEILAAEKAGSLIEQTLYSDAKAAGVLQLALRNLIDEFSVLEAKAATGSISVAPAVNTMAGNLVQRAGAGARVVDKNHPLVGPAYSRASSHMNPRGVMSTTERLNQTMFGMVPGSIPVNQRIGQNPQIYAESELPNIPGLTRVNGASTGIVASEAGKWHAMMATLGMQSKAEIAALKKSIATTGLASAEFMQVFDDVLPAVQAITKNAAIESRAIIAQLEAGAMNVQQARAEIMALNSRTEALIAETTMAQAKGMGRTLNPTVIPTLNQPVVTATGKSNMRELFKKSKTKNFIDSIARNLGVRTSGAGYNIETTKPKNFNDGGYVYTANDGSIVPGPNINADVVPAMLTPGEFVVNAQATKQNLPLLMAINGGAGGTGPNFNGGGTATDLDLYRQILSIEERYATSPNWGDEARFRAIMNNASALVPLGVDPSDAIAMATADVDTALRNSFRKDLRGGQGEIDRRLFKEQARKVTQARHRYIKQKYGRSLLTKNAGGLQALSAKQANQDSVKLLRLLEASDPKMAARVFPRLFPDVDPSKIRLSDLTSRNLFESEHVSPKDKSGFRNWGYNAAGNYMQAIAGESNINRLHNTLGNRGLVPNAVPLTTSSAESVQKQMRAKRGNISYPKAVSMSPSRSTRIAKAIIGASSRRRLFSMASAGGMNKGGMVYANKGGIIPSLRSGFSEGRAGKSGGEPSEMGGMGQFGLGMGLQMAGMYTGGSLGTGMMASGTALQMLPMLQMLKPAMGQLKNITGAVSLFGRIAGSAFRIAGAAVKFFTGPVGLAIIAVGGLVAAYKLIKKEIAEQRRETALLNGITKEGAKEAGISYETMTEKLKRVNAELKLQREKGLLAYEATTNSGVSGLTLTIAELKKLKETAKETMPTLYATFNNIDSSKVNDLAANLKAQFVAGGMSAQDATNKIYALIEASNKAGQGFNAIAQKGFQQIVDKGSAASFTIETLKGNILDFEKGIRDVDSAAFSGNVDSVINSLEGAVNALVGTRDASGQKITEAQALVMQYEKLNTLGVKNLQIGETALNNLKKENPLLASILKSTDTVGGMWAKVRLQTAGVNVNLKNMSSELAISLSLYQDALEQAGDQIESGEVVSDALGKAAAGSKKLGEEIKKNSDILKKAEDAQIGMDRAAIKRINDKIAAIRKEADAKKKAMSDALESENTELELQKLQLEAQAQLARGDRDGYAQTQLAIKQLVNETQAKKAMQKVDELAQKEEDKWRKKLDDDQEKKDRQGDKVDAANKGNNRAVETKAKVDEYLAKLTALAQRMSNAQRLKDPTRRKESVDAVTGEKNLLIENLGKESKEVREFFSNYVDPSTGKKLKGVAKWGGGADSEFNKLVQEMEKQAGTNYDKMVKDLGGGSTLNDVVRAMGGKAPVTRNITADNLSSILKGSEKLSDLFKKNGDLTDIARTRLINKFKLKQDDVFRYGEDEYRVTIGEDAILHDAKAVKRAGGGRFTPGQTYTINDGMKTEGIRFDMPGTIYPNINTSPRYNIPSNSINGMSGVSNNASSSNCVYNVNIALNGTNVSVDEVVMRFKQELSRMGAKEGRIKTIGAGVV
jgi:TP901 family phage tail tape measure protein